MLHPTVDEINAKEEATFNRYQVALATARCARKVTDEYVRQREEAEKGLLLSKEGERPVITTKIDPELRDVKAVKVAVDHIIDGEYNIDLNGNLPEESEN